MDTRQRLAEAVGAGDLEVARGLLEAEPGLATAHTEEGWSLLHLAANREVAELLLDAGADIHARNRHPVLGPGNQPLHSAVYMQRPEVIEVLLNRGADVNATDDAGWTALHIAVANGRIDLTRMLLAAGADPNVRVGVVDVQEWSDKTALELLAIENRTGEGASTVPPEVDEEMRRLLISHGAVQ